MKNLLLAALLGIALVPASADPVAIGPLNAFVFGNFTSMHNETQGAIAAGGNIALKNYSVNTGGKDGVALYAGGSATVSSGRVHGGAAVGGQFALDKATLSGNVTQDRDLGNSLAGLASWFTKESTGYAALKDTGVVTRQSWGGLTFTASGDTTTNVFSLDADLIKGVNSLTFKGVDKGETLILNLFGDSLSWSNLDLSHSLGQFNTLLNFVEATTVNFQNTSPWASVLAPYATITGANGSIEGMVVANAWNAGLGLRVDATSALLMPSALAPAAVTPNAVPEPAPLALAALGLVAVAATTRRRRPARASAA